MTRNAAAAVISKIANRDLLSASAERAVATTDVFSPNWREETTFLDVAALEFAHLMERDSMAVALIERDPLERFLTSLSYSDRIHKLPDPRQPDEVAVMLSWCRRLAQHGRRPILVLTEAYLRQAFGQLRELLCLMSSPMLLVVVPRDSSATKDGVGRDHEVGRSDRSTSSALSFLRMLPKTVIVSPKDGWELKQMLQFSSEQNGPVAIQVPRGALPELRFPDFAEEIEFGKGEILVDGNEVVLLAVGSLVAPAVKAAELLSKQGISAGVLNARFVEPLDSSLIGEFVAEARGLVTLEEDSAVGGFGTAVLEHLADAGISTPVTVSGAVGIQGERPFDELVAQIVCQAVALIDRANGTTLPPPRARRRTRNGPIRSGIDLFGFSLESLQRERELVTAHRLSPQVEEWYCIYELIGERKRILFQWCEQGAELTTLSCVIPEMFRHACDTKLLSMMLCVLLDDVADQGGREKFLELLLRIVEGQPQVDYSGCTDDERHYATVTQRLTTIWLDRLRQYPCYETFEDLLKYDQFQYFNAMRYSHMLNRNLWAMNPVEHDLYLPHAMDMMSFATTDLMCTRDYSLDELGRLREALWHLQCMGRVGNLLATWRREIYQQDFAGGVFARAVVEGDLSVNQLHPDNFTQIEAAVVDGGHERYYFGRWKYHRECYLQKARFVHAVDLQKLLAGSDRLFLMHLGGRGLI